jgi:ubiquinone/menaquinone biosynthesis C-methylase UbiE
MLDVLKVSRRARRGSYDELPLEADVAKLPAYYRRCFHWQTDGYLSDHSARLYDLGVEILFTGMADVMRRQAVAELASSSSQRVLDVGCGTGRLLEQLSAAQPAARLHGIDLSQAYIRHARRRLLSQNVELCVGNGEQLPYPDAFFDGVVSVFMFHELPARVRRRVFRELARVLCPGGTLVLLDAAQLNDSPELKPLLEQFPLDLHEPFFVDYLKDPLEALFEDGRWERLRCEPVFVAKLLSARKLRD